MALEERSEVTPTDGGGEEQPGTSVPRRWIVLALAATVAVYVVGAALIGGGDALAALAGASWPALAAALLLQGLVTLTWPLVHRASLRAVGSDVRYLGALKVSMSAFTVSHTLPGGGAVGAAVAVERLTRLGVSPAAATASAALTGPISLTTIGTLGAAGVTAAVVTGDLPDGSLAWASLALVLLVALVVGIVAGLHSPTLGERTIDVAERLGRPFRRRAQGWRETWQRVTEHAPTPSSTVRIFGWSLMKWSADIGSLALVFVAVGETPRLTVLLVGFGVSQLLAAIPATPGGLGVVEGGMVAAFAAMGIPAGTAVTVTLLYRILETWVPTAAGVPVLLRGAT